MSQVGLDVTQVKADKFAVLFDPDAILVTIARVLRRFGDY